MKQLSFNVGQYDTPVVFHEDLVVAQSIEKRALVRLDAVWRYCSDPTGTKYDFSALDAKVAACEALKLRVWLMIPMWAPDGVLAGKPDKTQIKTPDALAGFVAFCRALGAHFAGRVSIRGCSTGNEPNLRTPFAPDGADPIWQAQVTNAVVPVLPKAWRKCSPGMAPAPDSGGSLSPLTYLESYWPALKVKLHGCEIHPYGRASDIAQSWSVLGALPAIHDLVGVPIVASEYNSDGSDSDAAKAANVPLGVAYMAGLGYVERVFVYAVSDRGTDANVRWGIVNADRSHRPLYAGVVAAATHLRA